MNIIILLITIVVLAFTAIRVFTFLFGNWRATLNKVISQWIAIKQTYPKLTNEELFFRVLEARYPASSNKLMNNMHKRFIENREAIKAEVESGISVLDKFNLPILIYYCLLIEENSYIANSKKSVEELLEPITEEVKRQGFTKYL